jgi:hypothetical protein
MSGARYSAELSPGPSAALVEEGTFRLLLDLEVAKASRLQYPVSVVCLAPAGDGGEGARVRQGVEAARRRCRATDVLCVLAASRVCMLLVDAEAGDLPHIVRRTAAELDAAGQDAEPPSPAGSRAGRPGAGSIAGWSAGASSFPGSATTGSELLRQATRLSDEAVAQGAGAIRLPA